MDLAVIFGLNAVTMPGMPIIPKATLNSAGGAVDSVLDNSGSLSAISRKLQDLSNGWSGVANNSLGQGGRTGVAANGAIKTVGKGAWCDCGK